MFTIRGVLAIVILCLGPLVAAREWTSRSGASRVEAELIDVRGETVVLRTADGRLIQVPLSQLSLGDVHYVREAMAAAGLGEAKDAKPNEPPPTPPAQPDVPAEGKPAAGDSKSKQEPQLAVAGRAGWQAVPDPSPLDWSLPPDKPLRIAVPADYSREDVIWPATPSPFVALYGRRPDQVQEIWDLRTGERTGQIRDPIQGAHRVAVSPDGELLAVISSQQRGKIVLWSYRTGRPVREIELPGQFPLVYGLDFAGPDRLVITLSTEKMIGIWDTASGQQVARIEMYPPPQSDSYAISPGGHYLAVAKARNQRIELFDLRNGVFAGDVPLRTESSSAYVDLKAIDFSRDGSEFAALIRANDDYILLCWSLDSGELAAQHKLSDRFKPRISSSQAGRNVVIDFLPDRRGWFLAGVALVDRRQGGPVWVAEEPLTIYPATRRILDANRMLVVSGQLQDCTLEVVPIPWDVVEASRKVVSAGGTARDVGLPPLTQADRSAVKTLPLSSPTGDYAPRKAGIHAEIARTGPWLIDIRMSPIRKMIFPSPQSTRLVVNCDSANSAERLKGLIGSTSGQFTDVYDLKTGKSEGRFEVPYAAEFLDVSPSGALGVFLESQEKDRLDMFQLLDGKHVVGFRPDDKGIAFQRQIRLAAFVDDEHLLTQSRGGAVTLWSLAGCRAVYSLSANLTAEIAMDLNRGHYFTVSGGAGYVVHALSGEVRRRLTIPSGEQLATLNEAAWNQDGTRLAALLYLDSGSRLVAWDLAGGELLCDVSLPYAALQLSWTGPDHVALHGIYTSVNRQSFDPKQIAIVDVKQGRAVWNYQIGLPSHSLSGPDNRFWFAAPAGGLTSIGLSALTLPDPEAMEIIRTATVPKPLFGKDAGVKLDIKVGAMPDGLEDRRQREDRLLAVLRERFTKSLQSRGIKIDENSSVVLTVAVQNLTQDDVLRIRPRSPYRPGRSATVVLSSSTVRGRLSIQTGQDLMLWEKSELVESDDVEAGSVPQGLTLSTTIHLRQWEKATRWCLETPLPADLYHPDVYRGLGESTLSAEGPRFLRRHEGPANK